MAASRLSSALAKVGGNYPHPSHSCTEFSADSFVMVEKEKGFLTKNNKHVDIGRAWNLLAHSPKLFNLTGRKLEETESLWDTLIGPQFLLCCLKKCGNQIIS